MDRWTRRLPRGWQQVDGAMVQTAELGTWDVARSGQAERGATRVPAESPDAEQVRASVQDARRGDHEAFASLYDRFQPEILRYLKHRTGDPDAAEDLTQQVFMKAWQALPRYQERGAPFQTWLYRIAHNLMVDHFRRRRPTVDLEGVEVPIPAVAEDWVIQDELRDTLGDALNRLSDEHRQVLVLRFWMERSAREIGTIIKRKEVTVRGIQLRALRALRREIERSGSVL